MMPKMIRWVICLLALLPSIAGICFSPMLHGFAPDVTMLSSDVHCPPPHVFDHFVCTCVDPSVVTVRVQLRTPAQRRPGHAFHIPQLVGIPDMHVPSIVPSWGPLRRYGYKTPSEPISSATGSQNVAVVVPGSATGRIVPTLDPYGSFNLPANSNAAMKAAAAAAAAAAASKASLLEAAAEATIRSVKQQEILDKVRWREQLKRETAVAAAAVAAAELAATVSGGPSGGGAAAAVSPSAGASGIDVGAAVGSALDSFMKDTLRRILYGY